MILSTSSGRVDVLLRALRQPEHIWHRHIFELDVGWKVDDPLNGDEVIQCDCALQVRPSSHQVLDDVVGDVPLGDHRHLHLRLDLLARNSFPFQSRPHPLEHRLHFLKHSFLFHHQLQHTVRGWREPDETSSKLDGSVCVELNTILLLLLGFIHCCR